MTLPRPVLRVYHYGANVFTWAMFAFVGILLNLGCALLMLSRERTRHGPFVRATIRRLFAGWCAWLHAARLVYVEFEGFTPEATAGAAVYIANHPSLLDATFILSRLPDAICIFKPALMDNPVLGPAALMAGYASGNNGIDLVRDVASRVADGCSLLVFPEGTRTACGCELNPLRPGFALIAARANAPIRLIVVEAPRDLFPKGRPWWRPPEMPAEVRIRLVGELQVEAGESAAELTTRARRELSAALAA